MITTNPNRNSEIHTYENELLTLLQIHPTAEPSERVFFFDIDNCLYDAGSGISDLMASKIQEYGERAGISKSQVAEITFGYYKKYGLAIRGMILHHEVDPLDFDLQVDQALPLESILKPNLALREMLTKIKMKRWAFTNANFPHAKRVLKLLGIEDLFHGITYCDYAQKGFACKPELKAYFKAMREAKVSNPSSCYFIDDSIMNLDTAKKLGWTTILVTGTNNPNTSNSDHLVVKQVTDLPTVLPELLD